MFDVDADFEADDRAELGLGAPRLLSCRLKFSLDLSGAEAYTREVDDSIANTHLQHGLKRHPFTQIWKAQVCSLFLF